MHAFAAFWQEAESGETARRDQAGGVQGPRGGNLKGCATRETTMREYNATPDQPQLGCQAVVQICAEHADPIRSCRCRHLLPQLRGVPRPCALTL